MTDLIVALAVMLLVSATLGLFAWRLGARLRPAASAAATLAALAAILAYLVALRDSLVLIRLLPTPAVPIYGNWLPPLVAVVIGLTAGRHWARSPVTRAALALLGVAAFATSYAPMFALPPACSDAPPAAVCLQTSDATCSAAAAVTLLGLHGLRASEREMARLCLTRANGTTLPGLYRGLKLKMAGTPWDVVVVPRDGIGVAGPAIIAVGLGRLQRADARYEREWGWRRGASHAVVLVRFSDPRHVEIADPSVGREVWPAEALRVLWHGDALALAPRR